MQLCHFRTKSGHCEINLRYFGFSASEKARDTWKRYLSRENSRIVDIFVGQLKSCLKCTTCGYASNTFDPLWQLSLPIKKVGVLIYWVKTINKKAIWLTVQLFLSSDIQMTHVIPITWWRMSWPMYFSSEILQNLQQLSMKHSCFEIHQPWTLIKGEWMSGQNVSGQDLWCCPPPPPSWTESVTHACENITFAGFATRAVKIVWCLVKGK